jgi:23S rRNA pseudouridine1911/1915/1917 synthase
MQPITLVSPGQSPRRLDVFVSAQTALASRSAVQRWIESGLVTVNGRRAKPAQRVHPGDVIACHLPVREPPPLLAEPLPLDVLYEDATLLIVNKPAGLVVHPAPGHWTGTLLNGLVHYLNGSNGLTPPGSGDGKRARPGLVHRLDKGTSGVLVIARTDAALRDLSAQFRVHSVHRAYLALVAGEVRRSGVIDLALGRDPRDRRRVSAEHDRVFGIRRRGERARRRAVTEYSVAERLAAATLLEVRPRTGRMHQIRAHLASIGHPVLGDPVYGGVPARGDDAADPGGHAAFDVARPMLHAAMLGFVHPATRTPVEFGAPVPPDMARAVADRRRG